MESATTTIFYRPKRSLKLVTAFFQWFGGVIMALALNLALFWTLAFVFKFFLHLGGG